MDPQVHSTPKARPPPPSGSPENSQAGALPQEPTSADGVNRPWYREPLVWMLWAVPGSAVIVGLTMLFVSIQTYDGLVADDYYKQGLNIKRVLDRDQAARDLGLTAQARFDAALGLVVVDLREVGQLGVGSPDLILSHATRGGLDRNLKLRSIGTNRFEGDLSTLEAGRWYVSLGTVEWRLTGVLRAPLADGAVVELGSAT